MKAFVLAEHSDAAQELCAGARTMADEVVLVAIADMEVPAAVADKVLHVALPEGAVVDDAADTVIAAFDAEQPGVVLVEPSLLARLPLMLAPPSSPTSSSSMATLLPTCTSAAWA